LIIIISNYLVVRFRRWFLAVDKKFDLLPEVAYYGVPKTLTPPYMAGA